MNNTATTRSRQLVQPCACGRPVMRYVTSQGRKAAPYCRDCARAPLDER